MITHEFSYYSLPKNREDKNKGQHWH